MMPLYLLHFLLRRFQNRDLQPGERGVQVVVILHHHHGLRGFLVLFSDPRNVLHNARHQGEVPAPVQALLNQMVIGHRSIFFNDLNFNGLCCSLFQQSQQ